jgi:hypothetical protein
MGQPEHTAISTVFTGPPGRARVLVVTAESSHVRRDLGPLAWTTLQHLALNSHRTAQGWAVGMGVRQVAAGLGVTKDTAARAVARLVSAGLVTREQVKVPGGGCRSGYSLHLPEPMWLEVTPRSAEEGRQEVGDRIVGDWPAETQPLVSEERRHPARRPPPLHPAPYPEPGRRIS